MGALAILTEEELGRRITEAVLGAFAQAGIIGNAIVSETNQRPEKVCTAVAREMLKKKGYQVVSHGAFENVKRQFKIVGETMGRDMWYKTSEIDKVPAKK